MYKLLTPGPLTTSVTVKEKMLVDHCTWDDDYKAVTQRIRRELVEIAQADDNRYTAVLMQGSGTFGVESVLTSCVGGRDKLLIAANGAYGVRMAEIAKKTGISHVVYTEAYDRTPKADVIRRMLREDAEITHVSIVHCETTSGILNDIEAVARVVKDSGRTLIVDAMSSFGGLQIPVEEIGIDFLISSANKCIQGVPGFCFVIARKDALEQCCGKARSLALDLYDQWREMDGGGKWRFTSPTHAVLAFDQALRELALEGGVPARQRRYQENHRLLVDGMARLGFETYIPVQVQSPIITTFLYPKDRAFSFGEMYEFIKARGYAIYPGKLTDADTFRIGNIGEIYPEDIGKLLEIFKQYLKVQEEAE